MISKRITVKRILEDVFHNYVGWDNKYLTTLRYLILDSGVLLREYYNGTREKYINPFIFLNIGIVISLFAFNSFNEEFISVMNEFSESQLDWHTEITGVHLQTQNYNQSN